MKLSKYANSGGVCTAKQCKGVLLVQDVRTADKGILPVVQASAKKIGITFTVRTVSGAYPTIQTTSRNVPISTRPRWGKDYADPVDVHRPAVRRRQHPCDRQQELRARGVEADTGEAVGHQGKHQQRPEHRQGCYRMRGEGR